MILLRFFGLVLITRLTLLSAPLIDLLGQLQYVGGVIYFPAAFLTKASILFLVARVFRPHHKAVLLARILIGLMVLYYVPMFFIRLLNCTPVQKNWQRDISGRCLTKEYSLLLADGIINLVIDLNILLLPVPLVLALQISRRKKMQILMIFASGIAAFSAIVAFVVEVQILNPDDVTFSGTILALLILGEVSLGIICSSLPVLPAFYKHIFKSARKAMSTSSTYHELEVVGRSRSRTGVERVRSDYEERGGQQQQQQAASEPALHRQYLAPKRLAQEGPSFTVSGGTTEYYASSERLWTGEGILKTVKFERVEETSSVSDPDGSSPSRPPNAMLQSERGKGF
ncbi:MAG: hypothetical protein Q9191_004706 [Dirinaria sp. TL-2023a]